MLLVTTLRFKLGELLFKIDQIKSLSTNYKYYENRLNELYVKADKLAGRIINIDKCQKKEYLILDINGKIKKLRK
jgi:hypothetical protein